MAHLLVVVALISYGLKISHCAYAPKPNCRAERQHDCAPYGLWSHTHGSSFQFVAAHSHMHPNPIDGLKDNMIAPFIGFGHTRFLFSICCRTLLWSVFTTCALRIPSKLTLLSTGKEIKSMGIKGLNPYTISNGENSVIECTLRLYANSINGKQSSQFFKLFWMTACRSCVKVLLTTSVCPSVWGWQVVENNILVPNLLHNTFQK